MKAHATFLLTVTCAILGLSIVSGWGFETIVIDAGHGGNDEGTKWYHVAEKDVSLGVSHRLAALLRSKGLDVVETRVDDRYISLDDRANVANKCKNSLLVSIHFNASRDGSTSGFQTYHFFASPSSRIVAQSVQEALAQKMNGRSRGVMKNDYAVLARTNDCAVLVECGFISNKAEATYFASAEGQQALAEALAMGIMRVKPIINNDPPECEDAKCVIYAKKAAEAARRFALSGKKAPEPPATPIRLQSVAFIRPIKDIMAPFDDKLASE